MGSETLEAEEDVRSARRWYERQVPGCRLRAYWRSISTPGPGRPPISEESKALIVRMATENCWRARKVQAEVSKTGAEKTQAISTRTNVQNGQAEKARGYNADGYRE
jgi:hypothetical protein